MRKATIFFYVILNGTWVSIAYLLHKVAVPLRVKVLVVGIGVVLDNLAVYAGVRLATKVLKRPSGHFE